MSGITTKLRDVLTMWCYDESYDTRSLIENGRKKLFNFDYPIFDEDYRKVLETNFIRNFFMREIGHETEGYFQFRLETWLLINMDYYNALFKSALLEYNPLYNQDLQVTYNKQNDTNRNDNRKTNANTQGNDSNTVNATQESNSNVSSNQTANSKTTDNDFTRNLDSDQPDERLAITTNDGSGVIEYATKISENKTTGNQTSQNDSESTSDSTSNQNASSSAESQSTVNSNQNDELKSEIKNTEDYIQKTLGKNGNITYPEMIMKYRQSLLRIEKEMFREMEVLFLGIY